MTGYMQCPPIIRLLSLFSCHNYSLNRALRHTCKCRRLLFVYYNLIGEEPSAVPVGSGLVAYVASLGMPSPLISADAELILVFDRRAMIDGRIVLAVGRHGDRKLARLEYPKFSELHKIGGYVDQLRFLPHVDDHIHLFVGNEALPLAVFMAPVALLPVGEGGIAGRSIFL